MQTTIVFRSGKILDPIDLPITEDEAMRLFSIDGEESTYIGGDGTLELHSDSAYIYTDLLVGESLTCT